MALVAIAYVIILRCFSTFPMPILMKNELIISNMIIENSPPIIKLLDKRYKPRLKMKLYITLYLTSN